MLVHVFLILLLSSFSKQDGTGYNDLTFNLEISEDAKLLVPELIRKYGYPCETHTVVSKDGYILTMHRIPYGNKGPSENRPAVYLQHGILSSSADWVLTGVERGFAYILADAGYDVWMPNVRGTRYSRKHIALDPDKDAKKFWDFSWHDIGLVDVPSMIDHVIAMVKQEKIFYIGHSQGTTVFYVMCSERPEYNQKILAMFSLAPVAYTQYVTSPLMRAIAASEWDLGFRLNLGMHEFLPKSSFLAKVEEEAFCGNDSNVQLLCTNPLFAILGFNAEQMNTSIIPIVMGHTPAGASTKQFLHYAQEMNSGHFRQYDYGLLGNLNKYKSPFPPKYKLANVKAPVYLHYSRNDWFSNERDVNRLNRELGNVQGRFVTPDDKFNHVDYLYGIDAPELLYNRVIGLMKRH